MRTIMFNNPFGSFQETVAAAKEEREQLDRLLTISTPRERLLVAGIALLLVVLAAWLFLGSVTRSVAVDGVLVEPGETPAEGSRSVRAFVRVESGIAPQVEAGMPAEIELAMTTDREAVTLAGEIAAIAAVPLSEGLADFESMASHSVYRVDVALDEDLESASFPSRECRVFIELGDQSPIAHFRNRRP